MDPVILMPEDCAQVHDVASSSFAPIPRTTFDAVRLPRYRRVVARRVHIPLGAWIAITVTLAIAAAFAILLA